MSKHEYQPVSEMRLEDLCTESQRKDIPDVRNQRIYCEICRRIDGNIKSLAQRYSRTNNGQRNADLESFLFSEGRCGLLKGVRIYDSLRGAALPCLIFNIRIEMLKKLGAFAGYNETVRRKYRRIMDFYRRYFKEHGREPDPDEIMRATGYSRDIVMRIFWTYDPITDEETSDDARHGHGVNLHAHDTPQSDRSLTWYDIIRAHPTLARAFQHIVLLALKVYGKYSWREIVELIVLRNNPNWKANHAHAHLPSIIASDWQVIVAVFDCLELCQNDTDTNDLRALYSRMNKEVGNFLK